jgi:predicted DNA-binding transcriptional regulator YafY
LALDRIVEFQELPNEPFIAHDGVDFDRYFSDLLGVTKSEKDRAQKVILEFENYHAPYVVTKPIHASQVVLGKNEKTTFFRIDVVLNYELEREILGFGECVKVHAPRLLVRNIGKRLAKASQKYQSTLKEITDFKP